MCDVRSYFVLRSSLFALGLILSLFAFTPTSLANEAYYDAILKTVTQEEKPQTEVPVQRFAAMSFYDLGIPDKSVVLEDVNHTLLGLQPGVCSTGNKKNASCTLSKVGIASLANTEDFFRSVGRDLQTIVNRYKIPEVTLTPKDTTLYEQLASISSIWQADNDIYIGELKGGRIRSALIPDDKEEALKEKIEELIELLQEEPFNDDGDMSHFTAAIYRYRHGYKNVQFAWPEIASRINENLDEEDQLSIRTCPTLSEFPAHQLQYQYLRYCELEDKLQEIYELLPTNPDDFTPPLTANEDVLFPPQELKGLNVVLRPWRNDIALDFILPTEPLLPALYAPVYPEDYLSCRENEEREVCQDRYDGGPLLGGAYPGERFPPPVGLRDPPLGSGVCATPFGSRGYLCRTVIRPECLPPAAQAEVSRTDPPEDEEEESGSGITLTQCSEPFTDYRSFSIAGPDMCMKGGWRIGDPNPPHPANTPEVQEDLRPHECSNCVVDFYCEQDSEGNWAFTFTKDEFGRIPIRLNEEISLVPPEGATDEEVEAEIFSFGLVAPYLMLHEVIHAHQWCNVPEGDQNAYSQRVLSDDAFCCAMEHEAYLAHCNAFAEDGALDGLGVTPEDCANILSNGSCNNACLPALEGETEEERNARASKELSELTYYVVQNLDRLKGKLNLPESCAEAVNNLDPRVQAQLDSLAQVSRPNCQIGYKNTIGNNACAIGVGTEETLEGHRTVPGRWPYTVGDEKFPWESCIKEDPLLGDVVAPSAITAPHLPVYDPAILAAQIDKATCQAAGFALLSPPTLCTYNQADTLAAPALDRGVLLQSFSNRPSDSLSAPERLRRLGLGMIDERAKLHESRALRVSLRNLAASLASIGDILKSLNEIDYAQTMCTRKGPSGSRTDADSLCAPYKHDDE